MEKARIKKTIVCTLLATCLLGVLFYNPPKQNLPTNSTSSIEDGSSEKESGLTGKMILKTISTQTLEDGTIRKIIEYEITPSYADEQQVKVDTYFSVSREDATAYVRGIGNVNNHTVIFDCFKPFDERIEGVVTSISNPNVKASITLDYEQRISNISYSNHEFCEKDSNSSDYYKAFYFKHLYTVDYFKYTIEKTFKYTYIQSECSIVPVFQIPLKELEDYCIPAFCNLLLQKIFSFEETPSSEEIVNCVPEKYHSSWVKYLRDSVFDDENCFIFHYKFVCNQTNQEFEGTTNLVFYNNMYLYSKYEILVDGLTLGEANILF